MKQPDLRTRAKETLLKCLEDVPSVRIRSAADNASGSSEFQVQVQTSAGRRTLVVEVRALGQPRVIREAANQLLRTTSQLRSAYGVIVAPYISPEGATICINDGVGFVDLAGNCRLSFAGVFISKEGRSNPLARKRDLRSLYSPRAERVLRVLVSAPARPWQLKSLAREAGVSLGQCFNVKKLLLDREWMESGAEGLRLAAADELLREWQQEYDASRSTAREFYSLRPLAETERAVAEACVRANLDWALAGFSSAARFAPMVRYQRTMAYVSGDPDEIADSLQLKPVSTGANVSLITPYDQGVYYGAENRVDVRVTSPVQTYLDLCQFKGRGEEAAEFLKREVIEPAWAKSSRTTPPRPSKPPDLR